MKRRTRYTYQSRRTRRLRRILMGVSALCLILAAGLLLRYIGHAAQTDSNFTALKQEYHAASQTDPEKERMPEASEKPETLIHTLQGDHEPAGIPAALPRVTVAPDAAMNPEFVSLYSKNRDLVGWLHSEALAEIDYPVVKRDNDHYMNHDFYGRENLAGTVFLDEEGSILPRTHNLVLHGHNMKNGSMFGKLSRYLDESFLKAQPVFTFSTLYESAAYIPYAVSIASIDPGSARYAEFAHSDFAFVEEMLAYAQRLVELSVFDIPVDVRADDRLLTLATCHGQEDSQRLIIALRELRPGENTTGMAASLRADAPAQNAR